MTENNRVMTIKERYMIFKERNNNPDIDFLLNIIEAVQEKPSRHGVKELNDYKESIQSQIEELSDDDQELIERLYHFAAYTGLREEDSGMTKWDFFIETANRNNWEPVTEMINLIIKNDERFEESRKGGQKVSEKTLQKQEEHDQEDLQTLERMLEREVMPWAKRNLSVYYQDMINRTMKTRMRTIRNRLKRNTDLAFSEWLRTARKEKKMTLQQVADLSNTSASYIQRLEKGKRKVPSLPIIQNIADALNVPHQEVLDIISGNNDDEEAIPLFDLIRQRKYKIRDQEIESEQRELLEKLLRAALNENDQSEVDNLIDLPNIARELRSSIERLEQEDMSVDIL